MDVEVVDGGRGELTVLMDGRVIAQKGPDGVPTAEDVLNAVHGAGTATAH